MRQLAIIAHDMRSAHNVGSLLRTAEGLGVSKVYLTGYTPYPAKENDPRLPHIARKLDLQIDKTALGSSRFVDWSQVDNVTEVIDRLNAEGYSVVALEQSDRAVQLHEYQASEKIALLLGTEVSGLPKELLEKIETHLFIPMFGNKESFNVVQAAAMALYRLRFY
jgi:23S rRNA (guanosine2251-2'-O)-methyltransferase